MYQISQAKQIQKNEVAFSGFLALFDTFPTRCIHSGIKFEFEHLKIIFENELKMHFRPLCNLSQSVSNLNRSSNRLGIFETTGFGVFTFPHNSIARYLHRKNFFKSVPFQWNFFRGQKFNRFEQLDFSMCCISGPFHCSIYYEK